MNDGVPGSPGPQRKNKHTAVERVARQLRTLALAKQDGELLGSEEELLDRLKVSRPTLRQAAAQVAQEHLVSIRRGVGGGYFARMPSSAAVSRTAALYLRAHHAGLADIRSVIRPVRGEIAKLASRSTDEELRSELRAAMKEDLSQSNTLTVDRGGYRDFLRSEREFGELVGKMCGNRVLILIQEIIYDFAAYLRRDEDVLVDRPERVAAYRLRRAKLAEAILERDEAVAILASERCSDLFASWMHDDGDAAQDHGVQDATLTS